MMKLSWISIFLISLVACSSTSQLVAPSLKYQAPSRLEAEQLAKGSGYHHDKNHAKAILLYQSMLEKNPHNSSAMYELAATYYNQHDFPNSLKYASQAARYDSPFLASVYLLMGLNHENLRQYSEAIQVYETATKRFPKNIDLQFRLANTYISSDRPEYAAEILKRIITQDPYHADSHLRLGLAYYQYDYKTPALLSLLTFLLIEPDSARSLIAAVMVDDIFKSGVVIDEKTRQIALAVNPDAKTDEGDFRMIDVSLSARRIELLSEKSKPSEMNIKLAQLESYLLILSQIDKKKNDNYFVVRHYQPFYKSIYEHNLTPALLNYTLQSLKDKQAKKWLANNRKQVEALKSSFVRFDWKT